jgi:hypothetical protein
LQQVNGITIDGSYLQLQKMLVMHQQAGKLVCLVRARISRFFPLPTNTRSFQVSMNTEQDVLAVFDERKDMVLRREHVVLFLFRPPFSPVSGVSCPGLFGCCSEIHGALLSDPQCLVHGPTCQRVCW